jgi:hypothetical protein
MPTETYFRSDNHPWVLRHDTGDDRWYWENTDTGARYNFAPTGPSDDDDLLRQGDIGSLDGGGAGTLADLDINTHKNWEGYNILNLGNIAPNEVRYRAGRGPIPFPIHHTNYQDGLEQEEITRFTLDSSEFLSVYRLETKLLGGGTDPDFYVDIYDASNSEVLVSTSDRVVANDGALESSGSGATILLRVTNTTGTGKRASISGLASIRGT